MGEAGMALLDLTQERQRAIFDWHHTANDTLDKIDPKDLNQNVAVYARVRLPCRTSRRRLRFVTGPAAAKTKE